MDWCSVRVGFKMKNEDETEDADLEEYGLAVEKWEPETTTADFDYDKVMETTPPWNGRGLSWDMIQELARQK